MERFYLIHSRKTFADLFNNEPSCYRKARGLMRYGIHNQTINEQNSISNPE
jgi:hypothetical protein